MIVTVDIGGTKTLVTSFDSQGFMDKVVDKIATPSDPNEFIIELKKLLARFDTKNIESIAIGVPGIVDHNGSVVHCGNLPWNDFPLRSILSKAYACPIFVQNDAKLAGLAETHSLPQLPYLCLYVTIGTGIGTGIIIHGKLDKALAKSEAGHMLFEKGGSIREWESFASGHAIVERFGHTAEDIHNPSDWQEIAEDFAIGLQTLIPALQPDVIIIGGGIGLYFERFQKVLHELLSSRLPEIITMPLIKQASHPEQAVIYGCYYYATHQRPPK